MSRYRQSFNEALAQVEKWSKDVEVKSTGEHAGKTIAQLKKEVDALRGKPNNEKEMGGLLFAIRAKQGWKKGEGSTGVEEATQIKHEKGELKPEKAERGERKAGESEDDYEDRESGGAKGFRPDPNKKKKKQDDLDRDDEAQATRSKVRPTAEGKLPPHLAKFFDKKGNPNPEAAKRMAAGQKKRAVVTKVKDVTPKGYGPSEQTDKPEQGKVYALTGKSSDASIARGDSWKKSEVKKKEKSAYQKNIDYDTARHAAKTKKEALDTWHPDPAKDRKSTSMKHTAKAVAHNDAQKKKPTASTDTRQMAVKLQDILRKQRERKAATKKEDMSRYYSDKKLGLEKPKIWNTKTQKFEEKEIDELSNKTLSSYSAKASTSQADAEKKGDYKKADKRIVGKMAATRKKFSNDMKTWSSNLKKEETEIGENLEFKVKIKGIPSFYVPAKTAAKVKQSLRRQLKHPDDIESIVRVTKAAQKIDFRKRAIGKGEEEDNNKK